MDSLGITAPSVSPRPSAYLAAQASRHWPLLVLLFVSAALRAVFFIGLLGSDDTAYALNAIAMRRGSFVLAEDMTSMRLALNAAAAGSYGLLGISEWSIALPAFVASLLTLLVVYAIAWLIGGRVAAIIAGVLYTFAPLNILNSSSLLPEVPMALCTALSVLLFLLGQRAASTPAAVSLCLISGVALGGGYLFKEPAALVTVAFAVAAALAWYRGDRRAWLYVVPLAGFTLVFILETILYFQVSGVWLRRFRGIAEYQAAAVQRSEQERRLQSVWLYPRNMFLVLNQVGLLFYLFLLGGVAALRRRWGAPVLIVLWLTIPFLYLEFGSTSLTSYNALPKQPRYLEALTGPMVILLGCWLARAWKSPGIAARRGAYGSLAVFVLTSLFFTALSAVDRRAATEPIRASAAFLAGAGLRPVYATSMIANGLVIQSAGAGAAEVRRACAGCVNGPCRREGGATAGEVWAVARGVNDEALAPPAECGRWRASVEIPLRLSPLDRGFVQTVVFVVGHLPSPASVRAEFRPLQALLEPRYVVVNVPSGVQ